MRGMRWDWLCDVLCPDTSASPKVEHPMQDTDRCTKKVVILAFQVKLMTSSEIRLDLDIHSC